MSAAETVSVVIPVFNGERYLQETLDSVLLQADAGVEIIVVDDGSTDGTGDIARLHGSRLRYVRKANGGQASAVNAGVRLARGALVNVLDADDLWATGMLDALRSAADTDPSADMVVGLTAYLRDGEAPSAPFRGLYFGSALIRRTMFDRVGLQDETLRFSEDADWFLRALEAGARVHFCEALALYYRVHEANLTRDTTATHKHFVAVIKRSMDRRRRPDGSVAPLQANPMRSS